MCRKQRCLAREMEHRRRQRLRLRLFVGGCRPLKLREHRWLAAVMCHGMLRRQQFRAARKRYEPNPQRRCRGAGMSSERGISWGQRWLVEARWV